MGQGGGVEKRELTSSYEKTKITTNCWTTINNNNKMLEPTKKDTSRKDLHPKTKKKPQQDGMRGTSAIKSSPIHTRWVTHKLENNYTTEVLPQEWKFWAPCQAPQPGGLATGGGAPSESGFEGQQGLITGIPQDWRKQKLNSWKAHVRSHTHQDPGNKSSDLIRDWARLTW